MFWSFDFHFFSGDSGVRTNMFSIWEACECTFVAEFARLWVFAMLKWPMEWHSGGGTGISRTLFQWPWYCPNEPICTIWHARWQYRWTRLQSSCMMKISGWHGYRGRRLTWRVVSNVTLDVRAPGVMILWCPKVLTSMWIQQLPWQRLQSWGFNQQIGASSSSACEQCVGYHMVSQITHPWIPKIFLTWWHVVTCTCMCSRPWAVGTTSWVHQQGAQVFFHPGFCHLIVGATLPRLSIGLPCQYNWNLQNYKLRDLLGRFEQRDVLWLGWILNREMQARQIKGTGRVIPWSTCAQTSMVVSNLFFRHRGMCQLQRWPLPLLVRHQRGIQGLENSRFFIAVAARPGATSASQCEACGKGHLMNWGDGD